MPHRILNKHAATSVVGLISYEVGTDLDMSSAGMVTPNPPPTDIHQSSAIFLDLNKLSVPSLITVPTLPEMPHHVTILLIRLDIPLLDFRRYRIVVFTSACPRRS